MTITEVADVGVVRTTVLSFLRDRYPEWKILAVYLDTDFETGGLFAGIIFQLPTACILGQSLNESFSKTVGTHYSQVPQLKGPDAETNGLSSTILLNKDKCKVGELRFSAREVQQVCLQLLKGHPLWVSLVLEEESVAVYLCPEFSNILQEQGASQARIFHSLDPLFHLIV